ncbi:MAG: FAD-dependent oxidoreductase [Acidimicrobiaceae bacterium]|nr:FAD-dependent oxidoreductase [Acidimicrobiaceae bacterium]
MDHDLIIIGGGAGGLSAARAARWQGADVALISDGPLGGDCTFTGCVPSKTLIAAAKDGLSFGDAMTRVAEAVERVAATETPEVLRSKGVTVIEGRARLATHDTVVVGERRVTAPRLVIAAGSSPQIPQVPGIETVETLTNEDIFSISDAPVSLGIIGGGPVGCELAQAFAGFGVEVTLFEAQQRLLTAEEPAASEVVARVLRSAGVDVRLGTAIERVEPAGQRAGNGRSVTLVSVDGTHQVERLLVAVGRVPNSADMALEEIGVKMDARGFIEANDRLETSVRGVFAVGDVTGKLPFTHAADEMGRLAAGNALGKGVRGRFRTHWVPWTTFTTPEVARVGMTESEAAARGGRVAELPLDEMDRAITDGATQGFIKLIAGPRPVTRNAFGGKVLGATIVAPRAGEMIHEAALAMRAGLFTGRLAQTVHAYPTWSYGIQKTAGQFFGEVEGRRARAASERSEQEREWRARAAQA